MIQPFNWRERGEWTELGITCWERREEEGQGPRTMGVRWGRKYKSLYRLNYEQTTAAGESPSTPTFWSIDLVPLPLRFFPISFSSPRREASPRLMITYWHCYKPRSSNYYTIYLLHYFCLVLICIQVEKAKGMMSSAAFKLISVSLFHDSFFFFFCSSQFWLTQKKKLFCSDKCFSLHISNSRKLHLAFQYQWSSLQLYVRPIYGNQWKKVHLFISVFCLD